MTAKKVLFTLSACILCLTACAPQSTPTSKPVFIPTDTPYSEPTVQTGAIAVPDAIREQVIGLYSSLFGLSLPFPVIGRYDVNVTDENRWVSTAYIGSRLFEIDLFDNGKIENKIGYVNETDPQGYSSYCMPKGNYRILVVIVDYQNTGITYDQARQSLMDGVAKLNQRYAEYSTSVGASEPIFSMSVESTYIDHPPKPGDFVSFSDIQALTGIDASSYDLVGEVDLDKNLSVAGSSGAGGFAMGGCNGTANQKVNMWEAVYDDFSLHWLTGTLLDHELAHVMGWQHWWPRWDGSEAYNIGQNEVVWPVLLFGWVDSDGDGALEINDQLPYGMAAP